MNYENKKELLEAKLLHIEKKELCNELKRREESIK